MDEKLYTYFIAETNKKLTELSTAISMQGKSIAMLLADHHTKRTPGRAHQLQKYGVPAGVATGIILAREIVMYIGT
jgi:hypothetical protein